MKKILVGSLLLLLSACATYKSIDLTQPDADRISKRLPGTSLADLNNGQAIFEKKCSKCHSLNKPFMVSEKMLANVMPKMAVKANIDVRSKELVYAYIMTVRTAKKGK